MKRHKAANLAYVIQIVEILWGIGRISTNCRIYTKFAALRRFIIPSPGRPMEIFLLKVKMVPRNVHT